MSIIIFIAGHSLNIKVGVSFEGIHILKKKVVAVDILILEWGGRWE